MMQKDHQNKNKHIPVLLYEVLEYLRPGPGESYLDLTAGYGGHASAVLEKTKGRAVLVDRDDKAANKLKELFKNPRIKVIKSDYLSASKDLLEQGRGFDLILADLGVSSPHLNIASRGFSFKEVGPLDMRMDQSQKLTAEYIINDYSETELTSILRNFGEEPKAAKIAKAIVLNRPVLTTTELAKIVADAAGWRASKLGKIHPATRTFQAIRIAVNDELLQLQKALPIWIELLNPGGRIVVISFHSLEDRLVKDYLRDVGADGYDARVKILTKHPITSDRNEIVKNPRARSAKLRAAVKIKTKEREA